MSTTIPPAPRPVESLTPLLSPDWLQWVAENRLRGCSPESMQQTMVNAGIDPSVALRAVHEVVQHPIYRGALRFNQLKRKLESVMGNLQQLWESDSRYGEVEKRTSVAREEFIARYVRACRPVVLTDVARDWPALSRWSTQDLKTRFGHLEVEIQAERRADSQYEMNKLDHRRMVRLGDFVDQVLGVGASNDYYLTANNEILRRPEFSPLLDDIGSLPDVCDRSLLAAQSSFWFGPADTVTPLHHDTLMLFHTQIVGRKRWRFISPLQTGRLYNHFDVYSPIDLDAIDLERYPEFAGVRVLEVVVEPGETVFLPLGWWHQVRALDISMSFSYSNMAVPNLFAYVNPTIANW